MIKNYRTGVSLEPVSELELVVAGEYWNTWRICFDIVEHPEQTVTFTKVVPVIEEVPGETEGTTITKVEEQEVEVEAYVREYKYIDFDKPVTVHPVALDVIKEMIINDIIEYDRSPEVNVFSLNGIDLWLDKDMRVGLMNSTTIQKAAGRAETILWLDDIQLVIPCDTAIMFLGALEMYALGCFNKTAEHKKKIAAMTDIEDIIKYDYKTGYPEKLDLKF